MPAGSPKRNTPSTTTAAADTHHQQPLLPPTNHKATHIRNKDGTKLITVPSRKVSNPDSTSLSSSSNSSNSSSGTSNIITTSTTTASDYTAHSVPVPLSSAVHSASMDYPHNAGPNNVGGKKKKKKKGKQQQVQQQQQLPATLVNNHNHNHNHDHDHHHHHHRHDDYYDETHNYSHSNGPTSPSQRPDQYQRDIKAPMPDYDDHPPELVDPEDDEEYYSGPTYDEDDEDSYTPPIQAAPAPLASKKKNKKKKKKGVNSGQELYQNSAVSSGGNFVGPSKKKDRIWNTSTNEERERIKDFWLSLGEEERRSLVKVEKEAVLRKMKEQQKHSCSCSVCGRKRTAIEEELEVLYDAYYEELEQYAHQQQSSKYAAQVPHSPSPGTYSAARIPPPPPPGPPPGHHAHHGHHHQGHRVEEIDDDEFDDEDDDEYDDDDDVLDEPLPENDPRPDFFNFGNSLTVQGGILTVADDLLKNDGKKFIEMMEQLAERRMQREEEANAVATGHSSLNMSVGQNHIGHTHTRPQEYEDDEEYDEDEEDEEEYDDDEEDEPDTMTEEQRMEEGRRMFQIFAARMFEQRVLTAYREKVARERQDKLLEELDEEDQLRAQREEKKAKEKEKRREKKRLQKVAKEEERLKREAEKAEEEAKQRAIEEKKAEEVRRRKEEQRMKREAEKKAQEEERRRKDEEKKKRLEEEREREAEREKKRKEHQERERKKREEAAKKVKEEKEAREKEAREKREREERERKEREAKSKKEAAERERIKKEEEAKAKAEAVAAATVAAATAGAKRPPVSIQTSMPLQPQHLYGAYNSPHLSVATPAIPKQSVGHSPARTRNTTQQGSIQGSVASSPKTPQAVPRMGSSVSPSTPILQQNIPGPIIPPNKIFQFSPHIPTSPSPHHIAPPPGVSPLDNGFAIMNHMGMNGPSPIQPFLTGMPHKQTFGNGLPMYPPAHMPLGSNPQYRGFAAPNGMPMQVPAAVGMRPMPPQGRGIFMNDLAPGIPHQLPPGVPLMPPGSPFIGNRVEPVPIPGVHSHARALSGSFEPIQRPTPIQRPSSVAPPRNPEDGLSSVDELSKVMGSRALLEDEEDPMLEAQSPNRRGSSGVGFSPRPTRGLPPAPPLFMDPIGPIKDMFSAPSWSNPAPLGNISNSLPNAWSTGAGWSESDAARSTFNRRRVSRLDHIRSIAAVKCRDLGGENSNFIEVSTLQRAVEQAAPLDLSVTIKDLADILDVEGDMLNGGGNFVITHDTNGRTLVRFEEDDEKSIDGGGIYQAPGAPIGSSIANPHPGEIGSPAGSGFAHPFKAAVGPPPGIATNGLPSSGSEYVVR